MKMIPVESSNIAKIGHKGSLLQVQFIKGTVYTYSPVSAELFALLRDAESVGRFFIEHIKNDSNLTVTKIA